MKHSQLLMAAVFTLSLFTAFAFKPAEKKSKSAFFANKFVFYGSLPSNCSNTVECSNISDRPECMASTTLYDNATCTPVSDYHFTKP